jgi:cytochrome c553
MKSKLPLVAALLTASLLGLSGMAVANEPAKADPKAQAKAEPGKAEAAKPSRPDAVKGQAAYAVCAACHGADGNSGSPQNPKLAAQHPDYIVKQLRQFKSGERDNAIMKGFASALSDDDMRNIAAFLATQKYKPSSAKDKELAPLGQAIYRGGIAAKGVPACASCHGPNGAGMPAQYPRLGGQYAEYTEAQMLAFREGKRKNNLQMSQIAAKMNDREIKAVSDFIAGLR